MEARSSNEKWRKEEECVENPSSSGRSVNFIGEIIGRPTMTFNFIIRSNDTEGTFERKNTQHRVIPRVYRASMTQSCEEKER